MFAFYRGTFILVLYTAACGPASTNSSPEVPSSSEARHAVELYFPLEHDTVYAFSTMSEDTGEEGILMMHVARPRPGRIDLSVGGRVQRLESRAEGIAYTTGGYLLKEPVEKGSTWKGHAGTVTVEETDVEAVVPAGRFVGCVRTLEEAVSRGGAKKIVSVYCPNVGLVSLDVEAADDDGLRRERAVLKSFGPRVDLETIAN